MQNFDFLDFVFDTTDKTNTKWEIEKYQMRNREIDFYILHTSALLYLLCRDRGANGEVAPSLENLVSIRNLCGFKQYKKHSFKICKLSFSIYILYNCLVLTFCF